MNSRVGNPFEHPEIDTVPDPVEKQKLVVYPGLRKIDPSKVLDLEDDVGNGRIANVENLENVKNPVSSIKETDSKLPSPVSKLYGTDIEIGNQVVTNARIEAIFRAETYKEVQDDGKNFNTWMASAYQDAYDA